MVRIWAETNEIQLFLEMMTLEHPSDQRERVSTVFSVLDQLKYKLLSRNMRYSIVQNKMRASILDDPECNLSCLNGGTCDNSTETAECVCLDGYRGSFCEIGR